MRSQMCIRIRERAGGEVFACDYKKRREVAPFLGILDGREKGAEDPHLLPSAFKSGHTRNMHAHSFAGAAAASQGGGGNATRVSTRKRTRACYHLRVARFGAGSKERARRDEAHRVDEEAQGPSTRQFESHTDAQIMTIKCGAASDAQRVK